MDVRMANNAELKLVLKMAGDTAVLVSDVMKGLSLAELSEGYAVVQDVQPLLKDASLLLPEWEKLDDAARADLVAYAQANLKIPANLSVEAYVQKALASAIALSAVVAPWLP